MHEVLADLLHFTFAQQSMIHEHACQLITYRLVHQSGGHRRVDTPGQTADHLMIADLGFDLRHLILDDA